MSASVFYFGGYKASHSDVKSWKASAQGQMPGVLFDVHPYPDGVASDGDKAVDAFINSPEYPAVLKAIQASESDVIYIVGHSSGCAIANKVDATLKDHAKISLVALDGYLPSHEQLARTSTQVWIAESSGGVSLHHNDLAANLKSYSLKAKDKKDPSIYTASSNCTTKLALHFSLVNVSSSDALVRLIPEGYKDCKANLCWFV